MLLTSTQNTTNITLKPVTCLLEYSCKYMGRFEPRKSRGAGYAPLGAWLFLCPKSILNTLKNHLLWWGGLLEQFLCTAVQTNMTPHRPKFEPFSGGLTLSKGASHMTIHATKPTLTSRFNVIAINTRHVIAENISYSQAMKYRKQRKLVIKFAGMSARSAS